MKEFRVAKCLEDGVIGKYAIFKDGSRKKRIEMDSNGKEYFSVDNWIQSETEMDEFNYKIGRDFITFSFRGKPNDMLESIRQRYGDVIYVTNIIGRTEEVLYFLDREYGESLRQKTLAGWGDVSFKYVLFYNSVKLSDRTNGYNNKDSHTLLFDEKPDYFDSVSDAIEYVTKTIDEAYNECLEMVGSIYHDADSIVARIVCDMLTVANDEPISFKFKSQEDIKENIRTKFKIYKEPVV